MLVGIGANAGEQSEGQGGNIGTTSTDFFFKFFSMSGTPTKQTEVQASGGQTPQALRRNSKGTNFFRRHNRTGSSFKGTTEGMNGQVFQTAIKQSKQGQFQCTLKELQVYSSVTFKREIDLLEVLFEDLETPTPTKPVKPTSTDEVDVDLYKEEVKMYAQEKKNIQSTLRSIFNVVWGQCSTIMKSKLESKTNFKTSKQNKDVVELLKQIKAIMHQFESHTSIYEALDKAKRNFYLYYQSPLTSNVQHVKNLQDMVDIIKYHGGSVTEDRALFEHEKKLEANLPTTEKSSEETLKQRARDKMLGVALIRRADRGRYSKLMTDLKDQYTLKSDVYPDDIASAHNMLENYSSQQRKNNNEQQKTEGLQFAQSSEVISGKDGKIFENIQCHKCKKKGHYANQCPQKQEGIQLLMTTLEVCKETGKIPQDGNNLHFSFVHQDKYKKTKIWKLAYF